MDSMFNIKGEELAGEIKQQVAEEQGGLVYSQ